MNVNLKIFKDIDMFVRRLLIFIFCICSVSFVSKLLELWIVIKTEVGKNVLVAQQVVF